MHSFADYINDLFAPAFKFVGEWFYILYDEVGFFGVFLSTVILTIAFSALIMPFLRFGGMQVIRTGNARRETRKQHKAQNQNAPGSYQYNQKYNYQQRR